MIAPPLIDFFLKNILRENRDRRLREADQFAQLSGQSRWPPTGKDLPILVFNESAHGILVVEFANSGLPGEEIEFGDVAFDRVLRTWYAPAVHRMAPSLRLGVTKFTQSS